ncbi:MAG TPA: ABC transporter substrate-binding protein [Clostridiales bacterium]|nr:ABC transporter substrate-binding protein [Clostridiales bacterium]
MKKVKVLLIAMTCILLMGGCSKKAEKIDIKIGAMKGPTGMGMIQIMDQAKKDETKNNYKFTVVGAADEISTGLIKGELDIAAVPCNLASVLYNKTDGAIQVAGINTLGVLYILETGNEINSVDDLKGKTIYSTGLGTTPQYTLEYLLTNSGIDIKNDVTIEYKTEATEVAAILNGSEDAIAMLPQPFVTTVLLNNENARIALNIDEEWKKIGGEDNSLVTGVVVVRKEFLENNKNAFNEFMKEYKESTNYVNSNIEEAATLMEENDLFKAAIAKKAIPLSNIVLIQGNDMKKRIDNYLGVLNSQNPNSIGGKMPADDFYYIP